MLILNLNTHIKNSSFIIVTYINYLSNLIKLLKKFSKIEKQKRKFLNKIRISGNKYILNYTNYKNEKRKEEKWEKNNIERELSNKNKFIIIVLNEILKQIEIFKNSKKLIKYYSKCIKKLKKYRYKIKLKKIFIENILRDVNKEFETYIYDVQYIHFKINKIKINEKNQEEIYHNRENNYINCKSIGDVYTFLLYNFKIKIEAILNYIYNFCKNINDSINKILRNICSTLINQNDTFFINLKNRKMYLKENINIVFLEENRLAMRDIATSEKYKNLFNKNYINEDINKLLFHLNELNNENENKKYKVNNFNLRNNNKNVTNNSLNGITKNNENDDVNVNENHYIKNEKNKIKKEIPYIKNIDKENENLINEEHKYIISNDKYINNMKYININNERNLKNQMKCVNIKRNNFKKIHLNKKEIKELSIDNTPNDIILINLDGKTSSMIYILRLYKIFKRIFRINKKQIYMYSENAVANEDPKMYYLIIYLLNYYSRIAKLNSFFYKSLKSIIYDYRLSKDDDKRRYFLIEMYLLFKFQIKNIINIIKNYNDDLKILYKFLCKNNFFFFFISYLSKFLGLNKNNLINYFCIFNNIKTKNISRNLSNKPIILYKWRDHIKIRTKVLFHSIYNTNKNLEFNIKDILLLPYNNFFNDLIEKNHNEKGLNQKLIFEISKIYSKYSFQYIENEIKESFEIQLKRNCIFKNNNILNKMSFLKSNVDTNIVSANILENKHTFGENNHDLHVIKRNSIASLTNESNIEDNLNDDKYMNIKKHMKRARKSMRDNLSDTFYGSELLSEENFSKISSKLEKRLEIDRNMTVSDCKVNKKSVLELQEYVKEDDESTELSDDISSFDNLDDDILSMIKKKYYEKKKKKSKIKRSEYMLEVNEAPEKISEQTYQKKRIESIERSKESNYTHPHCPFDDDYHIYYNIDKKDISAIMQSSINNYNCALSKKILIQGKIFITHDSICFIPLFNVLFFKNSILRIKYDDILSIEKLKVLHFIPNSLKITTKYKSFIFMSFVRRNHAYNLIVDMIKESNNTRKIPKRGIVLHMGEDKNEDNYDTNSKESEDEHKSKEKIKCIKKEQLFSTLNDRESYLHIDTRSEHLELNISMEEKKILEENNYVDCKYYINSLYVNKNFKNIFSKIFSNFNLENPFVKIALDKKPEYLSYDRLEKLDEIFETQKSLTYELVYNILLFDEGERVFGLPRRSDVKETVSFFFFKNVISIQKSNILLCNVPLAGCFRTIITVNMHNLDEENSSTQIDFSYDIKFLKGTFFKKKIEANSLPKLEETVISLKEYTENAIKKSFKKIKVEKIDIHMENREKNYEIKKTEVSLTNSGIISKDFKLKKSDRRFKCLRNHFKWLDSLSSYRFAIFTVLISVSIYIFYKIIYY